MIKFNLIKIFEKLTLIFIFFPYVGILIKTSSDVQPYYFVSGSILLLLLLINKTELEMTFYNWFIYFIFLVMFFNLSIHFLLDNRLGSFYYFRLIFKYLAFLVFYLITERLWSNINSKFLFIITAIYFSIANLQVLLKKPIIGFLMSRVSYYPERNLAVGLTPEASFFAKFSIFIILLLEYLYATNKISKQHYYVLFILNIEMILISKSVSGFLLILIFLLIKMIVKMFMFLKEKRKNILFKMNYKKIFLSYLFITFTLLIIWYFRENIILFLKTGRTGRLFKYLLNGNIIYFFYEDKSFLIRLDVVKLTFENLKTNLFGTIPPSSIGGFFAFVFENGLYGVIFVLLYFFNFLRKVINFYNIDINLYQFIVSLSLFYPIYVFVDTMSAPFFILILCFIFKSDKILKQQKM